MFSVASAGTYSCRVHGVVGYVMFVWYVLFINRSAPSTVPDYDYVQGTEVNRNLRFEIYAITLSLSSRESFCQFSSSSSTPGDGVGRESDVRGAATHGRETGDLWDTHDRLKYVVQFDCSVMRVVCQSKTRPVSDMFRFQVGADFSSCN